MYSDETNRAITEVLGTPSVDQVLSALDGNINGINSQIQSVRDRANNEVAALEGQRSRYETARQEVMQANGLGEQQPPVEG